MTQLEEFNMIWAVRANHIFTQEELDEESKENPEEFFKSYSLIEQVVKKYAKKA